MVVPVGIGVVAGLLVGGGLGFLAWGKDDSTEGRVAACRQSHGVAVSASPMPTGALAEDLAETKSSMWADCTLPALPGASDDGYWEIDATRFTTGTSTSNMQNADVLKSNCKNVAVRYNHTQQGTVVTWDFTLAMDQVLELKGDFESLDFKIGHLTPEMADLTDGHTSGDLVLLTSANFQLTDAHCSA